MSVSHPLFQGVSITSIDRNWQTSGRGVILERASFNRGFLDCFLKNSYTGADAVVSITGHDFVEFCHQAGIEPIPIALRGQKKRTALEEMGNRLNEIIEAPDFIAKLVDFMNTRQVDSKLGVLKFLFA